MKPKKLHEKSFIQ